MDNGSVLHLFCPPYLRRVPNQQLLVCRLRAILFSSFAEYEELLRQLSKQCGELLMAEEQQFLIPVFNFFCLCFVFSKQLCSIKMWEGGVYNKLQRHVCMHNSKHRAPPIRSVTSRLQMRLNMYANNELCYLSSSGLCSRVRRPPEGGEHGRRLETLLHAQILHRTPENYLVLQVSRRARITASSILTCSYCRWRGEVVQTNKCVKGSSCTEARRGARMNVCTIFQWRRSIGNFQSGNEDDDTAVQLQGL